MHRISVVYIFFLNYCTATQAIIPQTNRSEQTDPNKCGLLYSVEVERLRKVEKKAKLIKDFEWMNEATMNTHAHKLTTNESVLIKRWHKRKVRLWEN